MKKDKNKKNEEAENIVEETKTDEASEQQDENNLSEQDNEVEVLNIDELKEKLEKAENASKDYLDKLQRSMAEFDNFRKRTIKEKANMYDDGVMETVKKLLPIIDNFERAVESASDEDKQNSFYQGIEMILKQIKDLLSTINVEEISAVGEQFNPSVHNAVMHIDDEQYGENEIIEQLQKGYKYKDKVIRPSMVKVAN